MTEAEAQVWSTAITVAGTLGGAAVGAIAAHLIDRSRRRSEERHRFSQDKRMAYLSIIQLAREMRSAILEAERHPSSSGSSDPESVQMRLLAIPPKLHAVQDEVALLAPPSVRRSVDPVIAATVTLLGLTADDQRAFTEHRARPAEALREAHREWRVANRAMVDAMRADLGLPGAEWDPFEDPLS